MNREEFEAVLALGGEKLVIEESAYRGWEDYRDDRFIDWMFACVTNSDGYRFYGSHAATLEEAINKTMKQWIDREESNEDY